MTKASGAAVRTGKTSVNGASSDWSERAPRPANGQRPERRYISNDYKLAIIAEYDRCSEPGDKGALLRREGLYSSLVTDWRRQHRQGALKVTEGHTSEGGRGIPSRSEVQKLRAENERVKTEAGNGSARDRR